MIFHCSLVNQHNCKQASDGFAVFINWLNIVANTFLEKKQNYTAHYFLRTANHFITNPCQYRYGYFLSKKH